MKTAKIEDNILYTKKTFFREIFPKIIDIRKTKLGYTETIQVIYLKVH